MQAIAEDEFLYALHRLSPAIKSGPTCFGLDQIRQRSAAVLRTQSLRCPDWTSAWTMLQLNNLQYNLSCTPSSTTFQFGRVKP